MHSELTHDSQASQLLSLGHSVYEMAAKLDHVVEGNLEISQALAQVMQQQIQRSMATQEVTATRTCRRCIVGCETGADGLPQARDARHRSSSTVL